MIERNTEFDAFASTYNRLWGAEYHAQAFPVVKKLLLSRLRPGASVLDVCCGTGQFTARVEREGFRVHGIDASEGMIRYARQNAPGVAFTVADVRAFALERRFDAAYSIFESLNHVPDMNGLELAFRNVRRHLHANAPFLFDLNREDAFVIYWNDTHAIVQPDHVCALRSSYDERTRIATCNITAFEQAQDAWNRTDFTVRQTCHDIDQAHAALASAGFREATLYDSRDLGMTGDIACARTFFLGFA